jgi:dephospho-CoA kinase
MKLYGLTGGIASGKSTVTHFLRSAGYTVIDMDRISRDVLEPGSDGLGQILNTFGAGYVKLDGTLDRKKLAALVFHDKKELAKLDALMGPLMWAEVERQRDALPAGPFSFLDAALLIEKGMHKHVEGIVLVTAPVEVRLARAMARDDATEEHIRARMDAQMDDDEKRKMADYVIENDGTRPELLRKVQHFLDKIHESL